jgi:hypothetical protein
MTNYKLVGKSEYAIIYVDYDKNLTKIVGNKYIYLHKGIYPYHNPEYIRRYKR